MPSIASLLKDEITRLSRREIRRQTEPFKRASAAHRKHIAALKRQIAVLQKQLKSVSRARPAATAASASGEAGGKGPRFVAKGLKTLRTRLGLSAAEFGKLIGVSGQSVYNWESKKAVPRRAQVVSIASLRGVGKREVQARLEGGAATEAAPAKRGRKPGRKPRTTRAPAAKKKAGGRGKATKPAAKKRAKRAG